MFSNFDFDVVQQRSWFYLFTTGMKFTLTAVAMIGGILFGAPCWR